MASAGSPPAATSAETKVILGFSNFFMNSKGFAIVFAIHPPTPEKRVWKVISRISFLLIPGMALQVDELHQGVPEALVRPVQRPALLLPFSSRDVAHMQVGELDEFSFSDQN